MKTYGFDSTITVYDVDNDEFLPEGIRSRCRICNAEAHTTTIHRELFNPALDAHLDDWEY